MNNNNESFEVLLQFNGEEVGSFTSTEYNLETHAPSNKHILLSNKSISAQLTNIEFDRESFLDTINTEQTYNVTFDGYELPKGKKMPKKKRIKKKWMKKYKKTIELEDIKIEW